MRPGHADFTAFEKYNGYQDYRGGGHFSGRLTACIVAAGSICRQILKSQGIVIGSHIESLYTLSDIPFSQDSRVLEKQIQEVNDKTFAVIDDQVKDQMIQRNRKSSC
ncbi:MAG: chorismate synthase [Holdemanella porci]